MKARRVVVTGANAGIGFATARALAAQGAEVILAVRDVTKGSAAAAHIVTALPDADVRVMHLDLSSLASVREFAHALHTVHDRLDVLINNAGVMLTDRTETVDGFETTFAVNHLGHFLLTNLLGDVLVPGSRVVVVASWAHTFVRGGLDFEDLQSRRRYRMMSVYGASKLANILFARELARRWRDRSITANALHPGFVATSLGGDGDAGLFGQVFALTSRFLAHSPEHGARTSVYLATSPDVADTTGAYFAGCKPHTPSRTARDDKAASRLWDISTNLVGLHADDTRP